jgi:hypothetical protein
LVGEAFAVLGAERTDFAESGFEIIIRHAASYRASREQ